ncbi:hypothetical protein [Cellulomonas sp. SLBN-39]|uniref:hypothetical protein n=1 Tax=Cellulomonas sp. SLBN-39 TaxID=2768446 RepID=UPI00114F2444|nr:hypothetical protein [Cellulomonas sp. SLBN-39]TQL03498.1 hypothetical protein FBY24_2597 [Cellulomonas sp. SLBN-39]
MSDPTLTAIQGVRTDVGALRAETAASIQALREDLSARLDTTVSRREHEAEVRRIDAESRATREAMATLESQADARLLAAHAAIEAGDAAVRARLEEVERKRGAALEAAEVRRREDRRYLASWMVGAVSAATAVTALVTRLSP